MHLETMFLQVTDLTRHIDTLEFYDGPPSYMEEAKPNYSLFEARFSLESLSLIYR